MCCDRIYESRAEVVVQVIGIPIGVGRRRPINNSPVCDLRLHPMADGGRWPKLMRQSDGRTDGRSMRIGSASVDRSIDRSIDRIDRPIDGITASASDQGRDESAKLSCASPLFSV